MMKKVTVKQLMLLSLFVAMAWSVSSQMKVGENPNMINKGSVLELEAKDKGVLYPRVALTASNAWLPLQGTAVAGMTVYNTATVTATTSATTNLSPGFYFWEGAKWNKIATESKVDAGVEWKDGTVSGTNLIYANQAKKAGNDVVINDDGRVGIGTVTPVTTLDIKGKVHINGADFDNKELGMITYTPQVGRIIISNILGTVKGLPDFNTDNNGDAAISVGGKNAYEAGSTNEVYNGSIMMITNGGTATTTNNHAIWNKYGRFGIGTTTPTEKLEVNGNVSIGKYIDGRETGTNVEGAKLFFNGVVENSDKIYMQRYNVAADRTELRVGIGDNNEADDKFVIGSHLWNGNVDSWIPHFTVVNNGKVGIGTTTPADRLSVNGNITVGISPKVATSSAYPKAGNMLFFEGTENATSGIDYASNSDLLAMYRYEPASDISELRMVIGDNYDRSYDSFVIGIANRGGALKHEEPAKYIPKFRFSSDGAASKVGGGTWAVISDKRTKENIRHYKRGLKELLAINPVSFTYKKEMGWGDKSYVGVIAQELEKVVPSMVITSAERNGIKDFKEVDGNEFTYMLINAVKEQQTQIATQQKEIEELKIQATKVEQLEKLVRQLLKK